MNRAISLTLVLPVHRPDNRSLVRVKVERWPLSAIPVASMRVSAPDPWRHSEYRT